jgi:hypothetical protein
MTVHDTHPYHTSALDGSAKPDSVIQPRIWLEEGLSE